MARTKRGVSSKLGKRVWQVALYARLSREDGDKPESDSIANQKALLDHFIKQRSDLYVVGVYVDDGYTGTNFDRPEFQRMITDIERGEIDCVVVKDLSRFGRDYIDVGRYLERYFPEFGVRFIAINDQIDSEKGPYDLLLPVKNVFNEQYARDISRKVKSAFQTKQKQGEFVGAFASYGYRKDPKDHNKLVVDPCAATIVERIFYLFEQGVGKIKIAKVLNEEGIPCPSEYKRLNGEQYNNGRRIQSTTYWTYATIHRMLQNQMYIGNMEQGRAPRQTLHGKAKQLERSQWTVVKGTHEAIISFEQWERVQSLLKRDTRMVDFERNVSLFAGFLRCGDCGRAMSKTKHADGVYYCCGSYKRYGPTVCSRHGIAQRDLEAILLEDLNKMIASVSDLKKLAQETVPKTWKKKQKDECTYLQTALDRLYRLKKSAYEDYKEGILSKEDFLQYKKDYEGQVNQISAQLEQITEPEMDSKGNQPWIEALLNEGKVKDLDRITVAELVEEIKVFEQGEVEVRYTFSDDLGILGT